MARMTEDGMPASVGQQTKQRTLRCPHCSIELNLPESAMGRRLKCPKCEMKFTAESPSSSSFEGSSTFLPTRGPGSSATMDLQAFDRSSGDVELPTSLAPLRETFDLPLMAEDTRPARPKSTTGVPVARGDVGDALALFQDEPKSNRKPKGAEARAQARRCSSCSSIVPAGMSLCAKCGLDLDTGQRVAPLEVYEDEAPVAYRPVTPPLGVLMIGSLCSIGFLLLAMISLVKWGQGVRGAEYLLVIWLFGLFGGVQFLRRKSIKPIFLALSLAVGVGTIYMIALPVYYANMPPDVVPLDTKPLTSVLEEIDPDAPQIKSITESLDLHRISWGVGSLLSYAAIAVYLNSPALRRQFKR